MRLLSPCFGANAGAVSLSARACMSTSNLYLSRLPARRSTRLKQLPERATKSLRWRKPLSSVPLHSLVIQNLSTKQSARDVKVLIGGSPAQSAPEHPQIFFSRLLAGSGRGPGRFLAGVRSATMGDVCRCDRHFVTNNRGRNSCQVLNVAHCCLLVQGMLYPVARSRLLVVV